MFDSWKLVQEDKTNAVQDMLMLMPIARTAMDKKGAKSLESYTKRVSRALSKRTPWRGAKGGKLSHLRDKIPSGETRVVLGRGEFDTTKGNPLFDGVKTIRE